MGYAIAEFVNAGDGLDEFMLGAGPVRKGMGESVCPEALTPRVLVGQEEAPGTGT